MALDLYIIKFMRKESMSHFKKVFSWKSILIISVIFQGYSRSSFANIFDEIDHTGRNLVSIKGSSSGVNDYRLEMTLPNGEKLNITKEESDAISAAKRKSLIDFLKNPNNANFSKMDSTDKLWLINGALNLNGPGSERFDPISMAKMYPDFAKAFNIPSLGGSDQELDVYYERLQSVYDQVGKVNELIKQNFKSLSLEDRLAHLSGMLKLRYPDEKEIASLISDFFPEVQRHTSYLAKSLCEATQLAKDSNKFWSSDSQKFNVYNGHPSAEGLFEQFVKSTPHSQVLNDYSCIYQTEKGQVTQKLGQMIADLVPDPNHGFFMPDAHQKTADFPRSEGQKKDVILCSGNEIKKLTQYVLAPFQEHRSLGMANFDKKAGKCRLTGYIFRKNGRLTYHSLNIENGKTNRPIPFESGLQLIQLLAANKIIAIHEDSGASPINMTQNVPKGALQSSGVH
jgi:hypothetical protein